MTSPFASASVRVTLDTSGVRAELKRALETAGRDLKVSVKVDVDNTNLAASKAHIRQSFGEVKVPVKVDVDASLYLAKLKIKSAMAESAAAAKLAASEASATAKIAASEAKATERETVAAARRVERETIASARNTARETARAAREAVNEAKVSERERIASVKRAEQAVTASLNRQAVVRAKDDKDEEARQKRLDRPRDINIGGGRFNVRPSLMAPLAGGATALGAGALGPALGGIALATPILTGLIPLIAVVTTMLKENKTAVAGLTDQWTVFQSVVEPAALPAIKEWANAGVSGLHLLEPLTVAVADGFANLGKQWNTALSGGGFTQVFAGFEKTARSGAMESINASVISLTLGLGNLLNAFAPLIVSFASGLESISAKFASWSAGLQGSAGLESFISYVQSAGHQIMGVLKSLGAAFINILPILAMFGKFGLAAISVVAKVLKLLTDHEILLFAAGVALATIALVRLYAVLKIEAIIIFINKMAVFALAQITAAGATNVLSAALAVARGAMARLWVVMLANPVVAVATAVAVLAAGIYLLVHHANTAKDSIDAVIPGSALDKAHQMGIAVAGLTGEEVQLAVQGRQAGISINGMNASAVAAATALAKAQVVLNDAAIAMGRYALAAKIATDANTIARDKLLLSSSATVTDFQTKLDAIAATRAMADAQGTLAKATEKVGEVTKDNARAIRNAIETLSDARRNQADTAVADAERITAAERSLSDAQKSTKEAQKTLTQSRVDAAVAIRDLTRAAEDARRAQEDATVSLLRQGLSYDEVMSSSTSTDLDKREALAKLRDAQGKNTNATADAKKAEEDRVKAVKDGVDKSVAVIKAHQDVTKAQENEAKAARDLGKAHQQAARDAESSARSTRNAVEGLAKTYEDSRDRQVNAAETVRRAQQGVTDAINQSKLKALELADKKLQLKLAVVPTISGTFNSKGDFIPSAAPAAGGNNAPEPARNVPGRPQRPSQAGWRIPGYGGGDTVPILAERGEAIVPKHLVPEMAPWAKNKGIPGFASGGLVGDVQGYIRAQDPKPYVWGATGPSSFDCSGLVGQVWAMLTGHAQNHRYFTTASNFPSFGFKQGTGAFTIGVNPGHHVVGNLAGLPFEAQSTATGIIVGPKATSVTKMAQQWYLPQIAGGFAGGGGGSAPGTGPAAATGLTDTAIGVNLNAKDMAATLNRAAMNTAGRAGAAIANAAGASIKIPSVQAYQVPARLITGGVSAGDPRLLIEGLGTGQVPAPKAGEVATTLKGGSKAANQALGKAMSAAVGWGAQWPSLNSLITGESGWNNAAQNPTSTAYGIFQFLNCVPMDTEILTRDGWKTYDQVHVGDETLGYNPKSGQNEWTPVLNKIKKRSESVVSMKVGNWESRSTPGHRWWSERRTTVPVKHMTRCPECGATSGRRGKFISTRAVQNHLAKEHGIKHLPQSYYRTEEFVQTDSITKAHRLRVSALAADGNGNDQITENEAALLGWIVGEGQINHDFRTFNVKVYQAKPQFIPVLDTLFAEIPHTRYVRDRDPGKRLPEVSWRLSSPYARDLFTRARFEELTPDEFILSLSAKQRARWLEAIYQGEGDQTGGETVAAGDKRNASKRISQNVGAWADAITLAVYLEGYRPTRRINNPVKAKPHHNYNWIITLGRPWVGGTVIRYEDLGKQQVWCVQTGLGTWTMRQGGLPILTGNSTWGGVGATKTSDPAGQIKAGLQYIKQSYGDPNNAFAKWSARSPHWYDAGGRLPTGTSIAINNTGRSERVLSHAEEAATGGITIEKLREALSGSVVSVAALREALSGMEFHLDERGVVRMVTKGQAYINTSGGRQ